MRCQSEKIQKIQSTYMWCYYPTPQIPILVRYSADAKWRKNAKIFLQKYQSKITYVVLIMYFNSYLIRIMFGSYYNHYPYKH